MSQLTRQMHLAPMTQVKYFSTETIEAARLRASTKSLHGSTDTLRLLGVIRLVIIANVISKKTPFREVAIKQYIYTKS